MNILRKIAFPLIYVLSLPISAIAVSSILSLYESLFPLRYFLGRAGLLELILVSLIVSSAVAWLAHVTFLKVLEPARPKTVQDHFRHCAILYGLLAYFTYWLIAKVDYGDAYALITIALTLFIIVSIFVNAIFLLCSSKSQKQ